MSRIKRGWHLTKKSWAILRANPGLARFPLFGGILTLLTTVVVVGPGLYLLEENLAGVGIPLALVGLYLATVIGYFFSVGLAASATMIFRGEEAGLSEGLAVARGRFGQIAGWALVAVVVSLIISAIRDRGGPIGAIFGTVLSIGWGLITFLAVPVIAIEGTGPFATLKRSASIFRQRWGQQVTGNVAIGGIAILAGIIPAIGLIVAGIAVWATSGFLGAILVIVGLGVLVSTLVIQRAMSIIFGVALYRYALEGEAVGGFTAAEMESAVKVKGDAPRATASTTV